MSAQRFTAGALLRPACSFGRLQSTALVCRRMLPASSVICGSFPHITKECAEIVAWSTLPAHIRLHNHLQNCILPMLLVVGTAGVAIDPESYTFDFVNCRHDVSYDACDSAS